MGARKKDSENMFTFHLQWKCKPEGECDVIGMYLQPKSTIELDSFKSYLLRNSGVVADDVKLTFLVDNSRFWVIDSEHTFQVALAAFRMKAKLGEVIRLQLDKICGPSIATQTANKNSADVQTQSDSDSGAVTPVNNEPPQWFVSYMNQFKKEIMDEMMTLVTDVLDAKDLQTTPKAEAVQTETTQVEAHPYKLSAARRTRAEIMRRSRRHANICDSGSDREHHHHMKSRFERKFEAKLEKMDMKVKKIKEKKQALISKVFESASVKKEKPVETRNTTQDETNTTQDEETEDVGIPQMRAGVVSIQRNLHMSGGQEYVHNWEIMNIGQIQWTPKVKLRQTWGSAAMKPSTTEIDCPSLKPGERGWVYVIFNIPEKPGRYESYWNFYNGETRIGHWVNFCVHVVPEIYPLKGSTESTLVCDGPENDDFIVCEGKIDEDKKKQINILFEGKGKGPLPEEGNVKIESAPDCEKTRFDYFCPLPKLEYCLDQHFFNSLPDNKSGAIDLSTKMQNLNLDENKSVNDVEIPFEEFQPLFSGTSNSYGIKERDLVVDLSSLSKKLTDEVKENEDNNNRDSIICNVSKDSFCEIESQGSDVSSGYDIVNAPVCDEIEDADFVRIYFGNNMSSPNPAPEAVLVEAENTIDSVKSDKVEEQPQEIEKEAPKEFVPVESPLKFETIQAPKEYMATVEHVSKLESEILHLEQETKSLTSQHSTAGSTLDEMTSSNNRLFIFPQNNPGFEVVYPKLDEAAAVVSEAYPFDPSQTYTWAQSQTRYTLADFHNAPIVFDPYAPSNQFQSQNGSTGCQPAAPTFMHVPNYQQSGPKPQKPQKSEPSAPPEQRRSPTGPRSGVQTPTTPTGMHVLPESLVNGAVNVASSAINTARSVINMIVPPRTEPGRWVNGHWVTEDPQSPRAKNLRLLYEMGFWDSDLNATLLARYKDDVSKVVAELVQ